MNVHLITNCTSRKRHTNTEDKYYFSDFVHKKNAANEWLKAIHSPGAGTKAIDKYIGEHWSIVRDLSNVCSNISVVSAGYGLISSEKRIKSYDATFNTNNSNSVGQIYNNSSFHENNLEWWKTINQEQNSCTSPLEKLYSKKEQFFILALSPVYLKVLESEIVHLIGCGVINSNNTRIISSDVKVNSSLNDVFLKSSETFCNELGGSRISLNIRVAKFLLNNINENYSFSRSIDENYKRLINYAVPAKKYDRKKITDDELRTLILQHIVQLKGVKVTCSSLLRRLRQMGYACEQKRFSAHFKDVFFVEDKK